MKKLLTYLLAILAFVACSESGIDNNGNGNNDNIEQPQITLNTTSINFTASGGPKEIFFTSSEEWSAQVITKNGAGKWCSIDANKGSAGDAKLNVMTTINETSSTREASIVIKAGNCQKTITVLQNGSESIILKVDLKSDQGEARMHSAIASSFGQNVISITKQNGSYYITLAPGYTIIPNMAFAWSDITRINIPEGITSIGDHAFVRCDYLNNIRIPNSVTSIGKNPFYNCDRLSSFYGKFASKDGKCLIHNGKLISFAEYRMESYTIPDGVTTIGVNAFAGCTGTFPDVISLKNISIPESVTSIEEEAFNGCI